MAYKVSTLPSDDASSSVKVKHYDEGGDIMLCQGNDLVYLSVDQMRALVSLLAAYSGPTNPVPGSDWQ